MALGAEEPGGRPRGRITRLSSRPAATPGPLALYAYLLDADSELAEELDLRERPTARQHLTARVLHADSGDFALEPWLGVVGPGPGLLILEGLIAIDTCITDRTIRSCSAAATS